MGNTKKVRTTGRLGSRYGVGIRKKLLKIEDKQESNYNCPFCGFKKVKRTAAGLYVCRKCNAKFAGGAYLPSTLPGTIIKKTVAQKSFAAKAFALEQMVEKKKEEPVKEEKSAKKEKKEEKEEKPAKKEKPSKEEKKEKPKKAQKKGKIR